MKILKHCQSVFDHFVGLEFKGLICKCLWIHHESRKFFIIVKLVLIFAPLQNRVFPYFFRSDSKDDL